MHGDSFHSIPAESVKTTERDGGPPGPNERDAFPEWFVAARAAADGRYGSVVHEGCRIAYQTWGRSGSRPLVLLHGAGASSEWWEATAILLAESFHVIAPSFAGCGRSEWRERYKIEQSVAEAWACASREFASAAGAKPICVAHSFGSEVGVRLAIDPARRISQLILVDSLMDLYGSPSDSFRLRDRQFYSSHEDAVRRYTTVPRDDFGPKFLRRHVASESLERVSDACGSERWSWRADPNVMARLDSPPIFARIGEARCPIDLIFGGRSSMNSEELRARQVSAIPGQPRLVSIEEAGHHVPLDRPRELAEAIRHLVIAERPA